jgi:hypothetical protein
MVIYMPRSTKIIKSIANFLNLKEEIRLDGRPIWVSSAGECAPFFEPDIKSRRGGIQVLGGIGLYITDFESSWKRLLDSSGFPKRFADTTLIGCYITNIPGLQRPPVFPSEFDDEDLDQACLEWIDKISRVLIGLPKNLKEVENCIEKGEFSEIDIMRFIGHPVKWNYFAKWSSENNLPNSAQFASSVNLSRIEPYQCLENQLPFV